MASWLSEREQRLVAGAETASAETPIPTQIVSNGEYLPPPQSEAQKRVERRIMELADIHGKRLGLGRRHFIRDDFAHQEILGIPKFVAEHWNPKVAAEGITFTQFKFPNYIKEVFYDSDTSMSLLSGAPFDDPTWWLLMND